MTKRIQLGMRSLSFDSIVYKYKISSFYASSEITINWTKEKNLIETTQLQLKIYKTKIINPF